MALNPQFVSVANNQAAIFLLADGTTAKKIWDTTYADGGVVDQIHLVNLDTVAREVELYFRKAAVNYQLCVFEIPASAGDDGNPAYIPPINLVDPSILPGVDADPNRRLTLEVGDELWLAMRVALAGAPAAMHVAVFGGDY